jgi:hypothetical protein
MNQQKVWLFEQSNIPLQYVEKESNDERFVMMGMCADFNDENDNGRLYDKDDYLTHFDYLLPQIKKMTLLGSSDHNEDYNVSMKDVSHVILDLWYDKDKNQVWIKIELIPTINGNGMDLIAMVKKGIPLFISSRATGYYTDKKKVVIDTIYTYDVVYRPGFKNALLERIFESKQKHTTISLFEWKEENNTINKQTTENNMESISKEEFNKFTDSINNKFSEVISMISSKNLSEGLVRKHGDPIIKKVIAPINENLINPNFPLTPGCKFYSKLVKNDDAIFDCYFICCDDNLVCESFEFPEKDCESAISLFLTLNKVKTEEYLSGTDIVPGCKEIVRDMIISLTSKLTIEEIEEINNKIVACTKKEKYTGTEPVIINENKNNDFKDETINVMKIKMHEMVETINKIATAMNEEMDSKDNKKELLKFGFREFTETDWSGFAGAEEGSLMYDDTNNTIFIYSPESSTLSIMVADDEGSLKQVDIVTENPKNVIEVIKNTQNKEFEEVKEWLDDNNYGYESLNESKETFKNILSAVCDYLEHNEKSNDSDSKSFDDIMKKHFKRNFKYDDYLSTGGGRSSWMNILEEIPEEKYDNIESELKKKFGSKISLNESKKFKVKRKLNESTDYLSDEPIPVDDLFELLEDSKKDGELLEFRFYKNTEKKDDFVKINNKKELLNLIKKFKKDSKSSFLIFDGESYGHLYLDKDGNIEGGARYGGNYGIEDYFETLGLISEHDYEFPDDDDDDLNESSNPYDKWRRVQNGNSIASAIFHIKDSMGNKKRYVVYMKYKETMGGDSISFSERLIGGTEGSGTPFSLSNMQNKPTKFFDSEELVTYTEEEEFNTKIIDQLKTSAKSTIESFYKENMESDLVAEVKKWLNTGVMNFEKVEFKSHLSNLSESKMLTKFTNINQIRNLRKKENIFESKNFVNIQKEINSLKEQNFRLANLLESTTKEIKILKNYSDLASKHVVRLEESSTNINPKIADLEKSFTNQLIELKESIQSNKKFKFYLIPNSKLTNKDFELLVPNKEILDYGTEKDKKYFVVKGINPEEVKKSSKDIESFVEINSDSNENLEVMLENAKKKRASISYSLLESKYSFLKNVNDSVKEYFGSLNDIKKKRISESINDKKLKNENEIVKFILESKEDTDILFDNIPQPMIPLFEGLAKNEKNSIISLFRIKDIRTNEDAKMFWESLNLEGRQKIGDLSESVNFSKEKQNTFDVLGYDINSVKL